VEQCSSLGYYILPVTLSVPGLDVRRDAENHPLPPDSQHVVEIRVSRVVGEGLHEDLDTTNFSQQRTRFTLDIELSADFADLMETIGERQQHGTTSAPTGLLAFGLILWGLRLKPRPS
jgi:hypothetical protein